MQDSTTASITHFRARASNFVRTHGIDRRHGLEFLADKSMALGNAYSAGVTSDGTVSIQAEPGTLQHLVEAWGAKPTEHQSEGFRTWEASVPFGRYKIAVRIVEESSDEYPPLVTA